MRQFQTLRGWLASLSVTAVVMTVGSAFTASAMTSADGEAKVFGYTFADGFLSGMSDNGLWATYKTPDYAEVDCVPRRINLSTGQIETLPIDLSQYRGSVAAAYDITDDGEMLVGMVDWFPAYYKDGEWHDLEFPKNSRGYTGAAYSVSADGHTVVGWLGLSFTAFKPVVWRDGKLVEIGPLPTYEEMLERHIIDQEDYDEHKAKGQTPNVAFFKVSTDGKTVLAGVDHNYPGWGCSYIIYHIDEGTWEWIADDDIAGGNVAFVDSAVMSHSGEWVSCHIVRTVWNADGTWDDYYEPAIYHVPTRKFTRGVGGGSIIDNDGTCYGNSIPSLEDGISVPIDKLVKQKYGIDFWEATGHDGFYDGFLMDVSADGRTVIGQTQPRLYAYSVTLPVPLKEAATGINLLEDWTPFPPAGTRISRLESVMVQFTSTATPSKDLQASLLCDGVTVATSTGTRRVQGNTWSIEFPTTMLEEGKTYTVSLPEGMFGGRNAASKSPAISWNLQGRADAPMIPINVTPREDSAVIELGSYNMVTLDFDTFTLVGTTSGQLYEKGASTPLCPLVLSAVGNSVRAYPAATRRLNQGKEYEVVIPAGAITDLTGQCPNPEIRITYRGSFIPGGGVPGALFFDDFASPNESLSNFLLYEGDHLTPVIDMQDWGFDTDNTPWNFSVRDESDYDYCAASHSRYQGAGTSDDWLVIPRLTIDSEWYRLNFKSQSHLGRYTDRLKIVVWESDEVLGSLDKATVERMKAEGTVIYDEVQDPGMQENILAGDWRDNSLSLAQFNGKNIYIAFVNDNTNQSAVFVDDIAVVYDGDFTLQSTTPVTVALADEVPVSVHVEILGDREWENVEATWQTADGEQSGSHTLALSPETGKSFDIVFDRKLVPVVGGVTPYTITVALDGERQSVAGTVANLAMNVTKRVLIEEGTGSWCGYCPQGFIALEQLEEMYGEQVVPVSIHNGDTYAFESYDAFLNLGGYPSGRVNRRAKVAFPISMNSVTGAYSLSSEAGDETFADMVAMELETPAYASVDISSLKLNENGMLSVGVDVALALNSDDVAYNLLAIVTEDDLPGRQNNYLDGMTDPLFGDWRTAGRMVTYEYPDVARTIAGTSFYGESGVLPYSMKAGEKYTVTTFLSLPADANPEKCRVVVALIDGTDGHVVNAVRTPYIPEFTGVESIDALRGFTVADGRVSFEGSTARVRVYNTAGIEVPNASLHGPVIVTATASDGTIRSARLYVR